MGLFGKSKKEREKEYMNRLDVPLCLKEDFELIRKWNYNGGGGELDNLEVIKEKHYGIIW